MMSFPYGPLSRSLDAFAEISNRSNVVGQRDMIEHPTAPAPRGIGSFVSPAAIIVAALTAATIALIRPYVEASTENTALVALFISVTATTSSSIYKACVGEITNGYRGRRWRSILFAGFLAGLAACLLGIGAASSAELAIGKEPSISPNGTPIIPISTPPPPSPPPSPPPPPPPSRLISYYEDSDGDKLGSGNPGKYERGSHPVGWVEQSGDKCPDISGSLEYEGCLRPNGLLIWYFSDVDHDLIGDSIETGSPTQYERGSQPVGWVEQSGDNCPIVPNLDQKDNDHDGQGDACEDMGNHLSIGSDLASAF
jgi:hypothetical protein